MDPITKSATVEHHLVLMTATADYLARERMVGTGEFVAVRKTLVQGMLAGGVREIISRVQAAEQEEAASTAEAGAMGGATSAFCSTGIARRKKPLYRGYECVREEKLRSDVKNEDTTEPESVDLTETVESPTLESFSYFDDHMNVTCRTPDSGA
ncbi:hypothetical protein T484DRAFT_1757222 [Baffinella frigidus]|nr:hypothetical protein T484DRAFT_1757222 [Cryptophyta sp. CCMP2293]